MNEIELASIVQNRLAPVLKKKFGKGKPFLFHLLGPPSVGKTFLQEELFRHWYMLKPLFLQVSGFVLNRDVRLGKSLSECSDEGYERERLRYALRQVTSWETVSVPEYDHQRGIRISGEVLLSPSKFIYLEGPIWLRCLDIARPDFVVQLYPESIDTWKAAYIHRNIQYRNYAPEQALRGFELAVSGYSDSLRDCELEIDLRVAVDFTLPAYHPEFALSSSNKTLVMME